MTEKDYIVIKLDLFNVKTADNFFENYASCIGNAFTSHEDFHNFLKKALPQINAELIIGAGPVKLLLHMERKETQKSLTDILNLPQKLAEEKKRKSSSA